MDSSSDRSTLNTLCILITLILMPFLETGCGSSNTTCDQFGTSGGCQNVVTIEVTPQSGSVAAGGSLQLTEKVDGGSNSSIVWKVNGIAGGNASIGTIDQTGLYTAPIGSYISQSTKITAYSSQYDISDDSMLMVLAAHRIGVQQSSSLATFVDNSTGKAFVPRGNNYIRLATLTFPNQGTGVGHSTFNVGFYNPQEVETALATMQANGYNAARVFLQGCCESGVGDVTAGISSAYLDNLVDFLTRAESHGISVMITNEGLPAFGGYGTNCSQPQNFGDVNLYGLCAETVATAQKFWHDFVSALIAKNAPMQSILAYELDNEHHYEATAPPLSLTTGTVMTANGQTYDMSDTDSRQKMMDDGLIYYTDQIRSSILAVDPTAMVTVGFFVPQGPNPTRQGDTRLSEVYPAMANSTADFVDLHAYPIPGDLTLDQIVQNFGFVGYQQQKPVMMGEFGGFKSEYATAADAATGLNAWQTQSCAYHFDGWLVWTWDDEQETELWNTLSSGGAINQQLAPKVKPDPCAK